MLGWNPENNFWSRQAPFHVAQGFQRYLLQTMYADRVLGKIIDQLQAHGVFDSTTLVVTADHGVAFTPGHQRRATEVNSAGVAENNAVPLLWKAPGQSSPVLDDRNVELVDVLPTLLASLGAAPDSYWSDGLAMDATPRRSMKRFTGQDYSPDIWPLILSARSRLFQTMEFRQQPDGGQFPFPARYARWIGQEIHTPARARGSVEINNLRFFRRILAYDPNMEVLPNFVNGLVRSPEKLSVLAVAINQVIVDVVELFDDSAGQRKFATVFDPGHLRDGPNDISFFGGVARGDGAFDWIPLLHDSRSFYLKKSIPHNQDGAPLQLAQKRLVAAIDSLNPAWPSNSCNIEGWMADNSRWQPPLAYLVIYGDTEIVARATAPRPDLASIAPGMVNAGFSITFRYEGEFDLTKLRIYVILDEHTYAEIKLTLGFLR